MIDFTEFVAARQESLCRTAWALTGDAGRADDLVQSALVRVWPRCDAITATGDPEPNVKRVVYTSYLSWRHRRWRGEVPHAAVPEPQAAPPAEESRPGLIPGPMGDWYAVIDATTEHVRFLGGRAYSN